MRDRRVIRRLFDFGHFRNPRLPDTHNITAADLEKLKISDPVVKEAIRSYQSFFKAELSKRSQQAAKRPIRVDGVTGPVTEALLSERRCGVPEYGGMEEANWPTACRGNITTAYQMTMRGLSATELNSVWTEALRNWNGALSDVKMSLLGTDRNAINSARIWAQGKALPGSTLAWSYLAQNSCSVRLQQAYDTTISWSSVLFVTTCTHEIGHALGLQHQRDSAATMYPSINSAARSRRGFPNATDLKACRNIGYTIADNPKPEPPGGPDPPGPDPPGDGLVIVDGKITLRIGGTEHYLRLIPSGGF